MVGIIIALILRGIFILLGAAADRELQLDLLHLRRVPGLHGVHAGVRQRPLAEDESRAHRASCASGSPSPTTTTATRSAPSSTARRSSRRCSSCSSRSARPTCCSRSTRSRRSSASPQDPFIVFTANIFALMGLRQLYFLLGDLLDKLDLPAIRHRVHPRLHRRQARPPRAARERAAVHQRRRARRVGAGDRHLAVARRDRRLDGRRDDREPDQDEARSRTCRIPASCTWEAPPIRRMAQAPRRQDATTASRAGLREARLLLVLSRARRMRTSGVPIDACRRTECSSAATVAACGSTARR